MRQTFGKPLKDKKDQDGAITLFATLAMVMLIAFAGLALDTGRAILAKNEMQAAAEACALGAALELNGTSDAPLRASLAGRFLASRNNVNLQSEPVTIPLSDIGFATTADGVFVSASALSSANARLVRYVRCKAEIRSFVAALLGVVYIPEFQIDATATAGALPSQAVCSLPMALCARGTGTNFGYAVGGTANLTEKSGDAVTAADMDTIGKFVWSNPGMDPTLSGLDVLGNAFITNGVCDSPTEVGRCITTFGGARATLTEDWNSRFGVYKSGGAALSTSNSTPDLSGHGYTTTPAGGNYPNYSSSRVPNRAPFTGSVPSYSAVSTVNRNFGAPYRRLAIMPVVECGPTSCGGGQQPIVGWACVLMTTPVQSSDLKLVEFVSRADDPNSPCRAPGVPGGAGSVGPLVPTLVG